MKIQKLKFVWNTAPDNLRVLKISRATPNWRIFLLMFCAERTMIHPWFWYELSLKCVLADCCVIIVNFPKIVGIFLCCSACVWTCVVPSQKLLSWILSSSCIYNIIYQMAWALENKVIYYITRKTHIWESLKMSSGIGRKVVNSGQYWEGGLY